ncbi:phosphatase PAP2 family protein [Streptomyces sp. M41(2017)]|uniref:phosphatase PAP2 family protein n=1 Tax=Streptomyces sp. M41(2017) TaxID=1955065 RepID=UPI0009BD3D87|nr:phosphatase PAP2 family protein [Streptomyces sp. M41(2017)]
MDSRTEPAVSTSASESAPEPEPPDAAEPAGAPRSALAWAHTTAHRTGPDLRDSAARPPLVREVLLVVGLFVVYKVGRQLATGHTAEAFTNAHRVWDAERSLHLPGEGAVQTALLHSDTLVHIANTYYATVHFPATAAFLVWLYLRRPTHYVWARRVLALVTAAALVGHLTFPLAPPRLLAESGLLDTGQLYGPSVYGAHPATDAMANQFAAMPSLHFGWALMVAIGLIAATRSRWRWLWLLHPLVTLVVIVGTANHYWLDSVVAAALLGVALAVVHAPRRTATTAVRGQGHGRTRIPAQDRPELVGAGR